MEEVKKLLSPRLRRVLAKKLEEEQMKEAQVEKIDAELVAEGETSLVVKKPKLMDLSTTMQYLENFVKMTPKEINDFIDKQSDMLMMYSKNAALEWLAKAVETGDEQALEMYLKVIQASAVVAQEKVAVKKFLHVEEVDTKPKQYVAEVLDKEDFEKQFKPGKILNNIDEPAKEPIFIGVGNKSVN